MSRPSGSSSDSDPCASGALYVNPTQKRRYQVATFTLKIELGNDAMQAPPDVAEALRRTARDVDVWAVWPDTDDNYTDIRDENGNTVGSWAVEDS